jgi:hypothetical protein
MLSTFLFSVVAVITGFRKWFSVSQLRNSFVRVKCTKFELTVDFLKICGPLP